MGRVFLPRGHPTIAFNEGQVSSILTAVANESARASSICSVVSSSGLVDSTWLNVPAAANPVVLDKDNPLFVTDSEPDCSTREHLIHVGNTLVTCPRTLAAQVQVH